jgi:hypothetical protein
MWKPQCCKIVYVKFEKSPSLDEDLPLSPPDNRWVMPSISPSSMIPRWFSFPSPSSYRLIDGDWHSVRWHAPTSKCEREISAHSNISYDFWSDTFNYSWTCRCATDETFSKFSPSKKCSKLENTQELMFWWSSIPECSLLLRSVGDLSRTKPWLLPRGLCSPFSVFCHFF